nr:hypothetical protein [Tanacetum cinerariifolium]
MQLRSFSRGVVFFVYFGAGIWYLEICLCTVFRHSNNSRLSQVGDCCFFLGFISSGYFHQWSSIFTDRSYKGFLVWVDQERFLKRVPTSSHSVLLLQSQATKLSKLFQLAYDVHMSRMIPQLVIILEGEMCTSWTLMRKKRVAFVFGSPPVKKARTEGIVISDSRPSTAEDVTSSSVTPTPERALEDALHDNVRTRPPSGRFVVLSSGSVDTDIYFQGWDLSATPSQCSLADDFYESQTVDSATAMNVYVPNWNVTNNARVDNPVICRSFLDRVAPPGYWAALRNQESEAAEVEELCKRIFDLEAMIIVKVGEAASLTTQNAGLLEKVSALELERDGLKGQVVGESKMREEFVSQQDAAERRFTERAAALDARIADVRRDMDNELYPSLAQIEAYDQEVEGKYVAAVSEFEGVSFSLLDELESLIDSPHALIMSALILKDDQGNMDAAPEFSQFQPSLDQVAEGLCPPSSFALGGTSGPAPSHDSSLGVTDYQVSTLFLSGDEGPTNPSPVVQSHDDLFDTSVLDKSGDV